MPKKYKKDRKIPMAADKMIKEVGKKTKQRKIEKVMGEYKRGTLKTSAGSKPKSRKQAIAIALSEARRLKKK